MSWLESVKASRREHELRKKREADAREARLRRLFEDDHLDHENTSDDEELITAELDRTAALKGLGHLYDRVNVHL